MTGQKYWPPPSDLWVCLQVRLQIKINKIIEVSSVFGSSMSCQQFPALLTRELNISVLTRKHTCQCCFKRLKSITILPLHCIPGVLSCLFCPPCSPLCTFSRSSCGRLWCGGGGCTASDSLTTCHKLTIHIQSPTATLSADQPLKSNCFVRRIRNAAQYQYSVHPRHVCEPL